MIRLLEDAYENIAEPMGSVDLWTFEDSGDVNYPNVKPAPKRRYRDFRRVAWSDPGNGPKGRLDWLEKRAGS